MHILSTADYKWGSYTYQNCYRMHIATKIMTDCYAKFTDTLIFEIQTKCISIVVLKNNVFKLEGCNMIVYMLYVKYMCLCTC